MRRKPRLVDKIAHGMSMFLSGPAAWVWTGFRQIRGSSLERHYR